MIFAPSQSSVVKLVRLLRIKGKAGTGGRRKDSQGEH
jgi:hypothetical protein